MIPKSSHLRDTPNPLRAPGPRCVGALGQTFALELVEPHDRVVTLEARQCAQPLLVLQDRADRSRGARQLERCEGRIDPTRESLAPDLGEGNRELYAELGLSAQDLDRLRGQGVI